ncbi:MAG: thiamine pyrophosphate-dependent enzyme [Pseudomonadota bacterium]
MLLKDRGNIAVVTGLGSATYDVAAAGDHARNYYLWGAMGSSVTVGLGLALARSDLDVVVVTGDGEMLMGLGALATIGVKQPENLTIVVLDNGYYGETGMQVSHAGAGCDMTGVAKACGLAQAITIATKDELNAAVPLLRQRGSTRFLRLLIKADEPPRVMPSRDGVEIKLRFQNAIGAQTA